MSIAAITSVPGARPVVELGVGNTNSPAGQAVWGTAVWNTGGDRWAGTEPTWLDITCDVHDIELDQGRDRSIVRWQVGTASITLDNRDGRYDVNEPPVSPAVLSVRPGRQLRVGVALDGDPLPRWLGRWWIDAANPTYDPVLEDVVELSCVDAKGQAGKVEVAQVADPGVGASETVTARMHRVLDAAGWLAGYRAIDPASTTLLATKLGAQTVDLLDVSADSAGGVVFGDSSGRVAFRGRDWQTYEPDVPVDDTIGNLPPVAGAPIVWTPPAVPAPPTDVLLEPFNNFTAAPWVTVSSPPIVAGRTGTAAGMSGSADTATYTIPLDSRSEWVTVGFAWKIDAFALTTPTVQLLSDGAATLHNQLTTTSTGGVAGRITFTRGVTSIAATPAVPGPLVAGGVWQYIEVRSRLHDTAGSVEVRVNGTTVLTAAALDTKNGGTSTFYDSVRITSGSAVVAVFDDLYVATGSAATFHGDITIPPGPPTPPVESETQPVTYSGDQLVWMGGTADAVCPSGWEMSFESADMATRVLVGRSSETPHQFDDLEAQILYGVETFTRTDLICATPGDLDSLGARILRVLSVDFMPNVAAVTIDAGTSTAARDLAATVDPTLPSRYRGYLREGGRVVFDRQFFAVGVSHRIDPDSWTCRIALDDAGPFARVGNRWDDAAWSSGLWSEPPAELLDLARSLHAELIGAH